MKWALTLEVVLALEAVLALQNALDSEVGLKTVKLPKPLHLWALTF